MTDMMSSSSLDYGLTAAASGLLPSNDNTPLLPTRLLIPHFHFQAVRSRLIAARLRITVVLDHAMRRGGEINLDLGL